MPRMTRAILQILLILSTAGVAISPAAAQSTRRPRVGVAFGGGSALGLAHIGVLKWFEEHHIPIDYISGTSMGGLVGGMYASGYTPEEMYNLVRTTNWAVVFGPPAPYRRLSFRRKEDQLAFSNDIEIGWRNGLRIPSGLNTGQGVSDVLSRFAAPYSALQSFDELPTPFRCVATNLIDGRQVILKDGSLPEALRATMSLPAIFSPVRLGGMVLVDGGLLNNLPVDVAKQMGADIVIAVELESPQPTPESLESFLAVARESISVVTSANERHSMALADLVLSPDLEGLTSTDFDRYEEFEKRGYAEAARKARFLETLALSDADWQSYLDARRNRRREMGAPVRVEVVGAGADTQHIEAQFHSLLGKPLQHKAVVNDLDWITGDGRYATATYQQIQEDGQDVLLVKVARKEYGPPFINFGLTIDGSRPDEARFGFGWRLTFMDLGLRASEWRNDFNIGTTNSLSSEYYWRVGGSRWFLAPRIFAGRDIQDVYSGSSRVAEYDVDQYGAGADVGFVIGRTNEFRFGYQLNHIDASTSIGTPSLPKVDGNISLLRARWAFDGTDSPTIPTRGIRTDVQLGWALKAPMVSGKYPVFESHFLAAKQITANYLFLNRLAGGTTFGNSTALDAFTLGGPFQLSALGQNQLRGDNYYNGGLYLLRSISQDPIGLFTRAYLTGGYELGSAFRDLNSNSARTFNDGVIGLLGVTRIGLFYIGGSIGERGEKKVFFRFGRFVL